MALTRFNDDSARIKKKLQQMTETGRYQLNAPGPGLDTPFIEDPHIRLQYWGANLRNNTADLENDLFGITRKLTHDIVGYEAKTPATFAGYYPSLKEPIVDESRATLPAWTFRDKVQPRWDVLFHNPQKQTEIPFENNLDTKMMERTRYMNNYKI